VGGAHVLMLFLQAAPAGVKDDLHSRPSLTYFSPWGLQPTEQNNATNTVSGNTGAWHDLRLDVDLVW